MGLEISMKEETNLIQAKIPLMLITKDLIS